MTLEKRRAKTDLVGLVWFLTSAAIAITVIGVYGQFSRPSKFGFVSVLNQMQYLWRRLYAFLRQPRHVKIDFFSAAV